MIFLFEGIDGSGKTTQAHLLEQRLKLEGINCFYISFPSNSKIGRNSNEILSNKIVGIDENQRFCFAVADILGEVYAEHGLLTKINEGTSIICDRFYISTEVYQAAVGVDMLQAGRKSVFKDLQEVVIIFLDVTLRSSRIRIKKRGIKELYEEDCIQQQVRSRYYEVLETYNDVDKYVIDGNQSVSVIAGQIYEIVKYELNGLTKVKT